LSKQPVEYALNEIKRKRAPVLPFATRSLCEQAIKLLAKDELVK
jgi:hypothetical protein